VQRLGGAETLRGKEGELGEVVESSITVRYKKIKDFEKGERRGLAMEEKEFPDGWGK